MNALPAQVAALLLAGVCAEAASAQAKKSFTPARGKLAWKLPSGAFVEYTRKRKSTGPGGPLWLHPEPAAAFYESELVDDKTLVWPSSALVDLIPQLAFSMSGWTARSGARSKVAREFANVHKFGHVKATGSVFTEDVTDRTAVRERGRVQLTRFVPKIPRKVGQVWTRARLVGNQLLEDTTLEFTRKVDTTRGVVTTFRAVLAGFYLGPGKNAKRQKFRVEETWTLVKVHAPRARGFQHAVNEAIQKGTAFLETHLDKWLSKPTLGRQEARKRSYGTGRLALILLTFVKGNPDRDTKRIRQLTDLLRKRTPIDTYSLAVSLMALENLYAPPNEAQSLREGLIDRPQPRRVPASDRTIMQRWVTRLLENRDVRIDRGYRLRFNYLRGKRYDNSVTQYAVLGLHAAALCGVPVTPLAWSGLTDHFLHDAGPEEGSPRKLHLTQYTGPARPRRTSARGFGYRNRWKPTGSMTCAGLTGLGVCRAMLAGGRGIPKSTVKQADETLRAGFAWIDTNYDVRGNPRFERSHLYYYLYGLERACQISGVERIEEHDWYYEGAMQLIKTQHANGSWGWPVQTQQLEDTCFAVLFLKKAVAPVVTEHSK